MAGTGLTRKRMNKLIDIHGPDLLVMLGPILEVNLLAVMVKHGVILGYQRDDLLDTPGRGSKCQKLLSFLSAGSIDQFVRFCTVMRKNNQAHIADLLLPTEQQPVAQQPAAMVQQPAAMVQQPAPTVQSSVKEIPLWDKSHPNGQSLLLLQPELQRKLNIALPRLRDSVRPDALWANLLNYKVMDLYNIEECQAAGSAGPQVEAIVRYLKKDQVWKVHGFFRAIAQIKQAHLIDLVLGQGAQEAYNKNLDDFKLCVKTER